MRELIESLVSSMLGPHVEKMESLSTEVEEIRRRLQLMIRLGCVSEIHSTHQLIKVKHGDLQTPFIKWFSQSAGRVSHYRCPTVGEQALVLNFGAGNTGAQSIAIVGIDSSDFPFPSDNPDHVVTAYGDNCSETWDMKEGTLTIKAPSLIKFDTELVQATKDVQVNNKIHADSDISSDGEVSDKVRRMSGDRDIHNAHVHPVGSPKTSVPDQKQ